MELIPKKSHSVVQLLDESRFDTIYEYLSKYEAVDDDGNAINSKLKRLIAQLNYQIIKFSLRLEPLEPNDIEAWIEARCLEPTTEEYSDSHIFEFVKGNIIDETNQQDSEESDDDETVVKPIVDDPRDTVSLPKGILHHINT